MLANTMAHAVAGAVLAQIAGGSAAAGAAGAAGGELAAKAIVKVMYPNTDIRDLTESQKQTVSALSQMAAGLAGGLASDASLGGGTGAGAGKNAVENNSLGVISEPLITRYYLHLLISYEKPSVADNYSLPHRIPLFMLQRIHRRANNIGNHVHQNHQTANHHHAR